LVDNIEVPSINQLAFPAAEWLGVYLSCHSSLLRNLAEYRSQAQE
jgi:hypothetical protein